jgi:uncharacterized membrane protein YphA (DoxX/SURF4 family)
MGYYSARGTASLVLRLLMGSIFLAAGLAKMSDPISFFSTLMQFKLFPDPMISLLAIYVPWIEFLAGLSLVLGMLHRAGALILVALNIAFSFVILSVIVRGIEIECGCFGLLSDVLEIPDTADWKSIVRNIIFACMSFYVFATKETVCSLENRFGSR